MEQFDFNQPPYSYLSHSERSKIQKAVDIAFFDNNEIIIQPQQKITHLYMVIKGMIKEISADGDVIALYSPGDTFDAKGLVEGYSQQQFVVQEEALVYTIPKADLMEVLSTNPKVSKYFYASMADKLASLADDQSESEFASLFTATVRDAYRQKTTWLDGSASILQAATVMKQNKTKSVLVRHQDAVGIFTESAFRDIVIAGASSSDPIYQWSPFNLISIDIDDFVFHALLRMTQFNVQRVVITEHGQPVGALEQIDVLAYFSNHSHLVAQRLDSANDIDDLVDIAAQMTQSIQVLHKTGVRAPQLAQLMQVLNTSLFEKAWRILAPAELYENSCLIVMGSEGRGEQILKTDQDNGLILREGVDVAQAAAVAETFSETLARLGYPPCQGKIMVNNPEWRKTLPEYKKMVSDWCYAPTPDAMMKLAIFVDAKPVAGDASLLTDVNDYLQKIMGNDVGMLMTFARAIELFEHHSRGFFAQLLNLGSEEKMDIKKMGIFPVVHGIRSLALQSRLSETNTFERIQRLIQLNKLDEQMGKDITEALSYLMDLRLKANMQTINTGADAIPNQLDTQNLSSLERDMLRDALQVVKRFKNVIRFHFHLGGH